MNRITTSGGVLGETEAEPRKKGAHEPNGESVESSDLLQRLTAPFPIDEVCFKPQTVQGNRALAVAYLDARAVMDRLDEVLGASGWQDDYSALDGGVKCTLTLRINGDWIGKSDVGSRSDQPDEGDQRKAAFSDALKRAAVKWGIGRYLYRLPKQWVGYDPNKRVFTETPRLPAWALPNAEPAQAAPAKATQSPAGNGGQASTAVPSPNGDGHHRNGRDLFRWLKDEERGLVDDHFCRPGELVEHVAQAGAKAGYGTQIVRWTAAAVQFGLNAGLEFIARRKGETESNVETATSNAAH
jgi:hypothetical protein